MIKMKKKLRVYQEDVKTRHTAHWDWDYLTWEEIEQRLDEAGVGKGKRPRSKRWIHAIWIGLGLLAISALVIWTVMR